jgi:hypothetical protein
MTRFAPGFSLPLKGEVLVNRIATGIVCLGLVGGACFAAATVPLRGVARNKTSSPVDLVSSRVKVVIGPQWIDVEEEAELQVVPIDNSPVFQLSGELVLPPSAQVTGCLFWRGDTVLRGKLRPHVEAVQDYNQIVNDTNSFSSDPLLLEKFSGDTYKLRAYPFVPNGVRKIRIRYLVPVTSRTGEVSVMPLFAQVGGAKPSNWTLQTRGKVDGLKLSSGGRIWALASPAVQSMTFPAGGTATLVWGANASVGTPRAVMSHVSSGPWVGDYLLYTGKIPDSLARKVEIKSETVILWRWIHPEGFVQPCGTDTCLTDDGNLAASQARNISQLVDWIAGEGNKVGLVTDLDMDEPSVVHAMGDSGSLAFGDLKTWIDAVDETNVRWRVAAAASNAGLELERNRSRFATDLALAGKMFSKDPTVVKHLLVVTVGPNPSGGDFLLTAVDTGLPTGISVASTRFEGADSVWSASDGFYVRRGYAAAKWPGVNLPQLEKLRGGTQIVWVNGVRIPRSRNMASATISMTKASDTIAIYPPISKGSDGNWLASFSIHDVGLGRTLKWKVADENGTTLAAWEDTPAWSELVDDSIVPRLWAVAPLRTSTLAEFSTSGSLGDVFGFVDPKFALLALNKDSLTQTQSVALKDSGVPFLGASEIFGSAKYKDPKDDTHTGVRRKSAVSARLSVVALGANHFRIEFGGDKPSLLEVLDVQGRVLARWNPQELAGASHVDWSLGSGNGTRRMLVLVRLVTASGVKSQPFAIAM